MKTKPFYKFPILLGLALLSIFQSCEKENSSQIKNEEDNKEISDTVIIYEVLIIEEANTESIFLGESFIKSQLEQGMLNCIGTGFDSTENTQEISILQSIPRDSILKFTLNEQSFFFFSSKILKKKRGGLFPPKKKKIFFSDFVLSYIPVNSQISTNQKKSTLFVNLKYKRVLGKIQIDIENKALNDYLTFRSSLFDSLDH
ncbi:MAG: hypothetical protein IPM71_03455 [Bacteroidota bacterium]|nr:MAG: hypothetical protein IPM71_03455 [Bacteroidota bacterium]